jgi:23S rRNA pseudouridine1911/1915/1917 synthase
VADAEAGERLDRHLALRLGAARNQTQAWIRGGHVLLNGETAKPSAPVAAGDRVACAPPAPREDRVAPEPGELAILYEDDQVVILDKPAGLTVHPGAGRSTGTLAHRLLARYPEMAGVGGEGRPGIVHRLDQGTSGVLLAARTAQAYHRLARAFAAREVDKRYLAIVYGAPSPRSGTIDVPIGRHPTRRKEMAVRPGGRPAVTGYRTLAAGSGIALLELDLATGRTHQIRVHLKHLGHPLVGDPLYGEARWKGLPRTVQGPLAAFSRPALHAWKLSLAHPTSGETLRCAAPVPADFAALWREVTGKELPVLG